jgi:molybdopterin converting factor small subunit
MDSNELPTPRTDAVLCCYEEGKLAMWIDENIVCASFARILEREIVALREELPEVYKRVEDAEIAVKNANDNKRFGWETAKEADKEWKKKDDEVARLREELDGWKRTVDRWRIEVVAKDALEAEVTEIQEISGCNHLEGLARCVRETVDALREELAKAKELHQEAHAACVELGVMHSRCCEQLKAALAREKRLRGALDGYKWADIGFVVDTERREDALAFDGKEGLL